MMLALPSLVSVSLFATNCGVSFFGLGAERFRNLRNLEAMKKPQRRILTSTTINTATTARPIQVRGEDAISANICPASPP